MELDDRAQALEALNRFAADVKDYEDRESVCEATVRAAERILDFDNCVVNLETDGYLHITAISTAVPDDGATKMATDEGIAGKTYRAGETYLIDDLTESEAAEPQGPYRSAISVPIGDHGIFQTVSEEVGAFDETDRELAELLVAHCTSALDRIERTEELRERTRRLERQNERLDRFAGVVSHDLRNPLTTLEGYLRLARETGDPEDFEKCEAAIERMRALTDDLLTLAREGSAVVTPEAVSLQAVAESSWKNVETNDATLEVTADLTVEADPGRIKQVLENLFRNSVEHAGDAVAVRVGPLRAGGGFYVEDDGPGIPVDERETIFEPGMTTREGGTGFGLSIVRTIAEAHGWETRLVANEVGASGARFEFTGVETA
jgi:signal transduction histidine kinase